MSWKYFTYLNARTKLLGEGNEDYLMKHIIRPDTEQSLRHRYIEKLSNQIHSNAFDQIQWKLRPDTVKSHRKDTEQSLRQHTGQILRPETGQSFQPDTEQSLWSATAQSISQKSETELDSKKKHQETFVEMYYTAYIELKGNHMRSEKISVKRGSNQIYAEQIKSRILQNFVILCQRIICRRL